MQRPRIVVILGRFHKEKMDAMLVEARKAAEQLELSVADEVWVPGSFEVPLALKRALIRDDIDGAVVLGIIERGETKHGLVLGQAVTAAIIQLQTELMKPVGYGIIGPEVFPTQVEPRLIPHARAAVNAVHAMLKNSSESSKGVE